MKQSISYRWLNALVLLLFFGVQVILQLSGGAFTSEFGGHPDEAAHYVTGLMVRDYVASLRLSAPMKFAENYYLHYPQVGLGNWPPVFYVVQALWTLPFSPSRASVILLMAVLTVSLAWTIYIVVRNEFGPTLAVFAGLLLIALPLVQTYSGMVMAEVLVTLLSFLAVLYFGRFLDTGTIRAATGFGIFAALAILTKGTALSLALVPPLAMLFSRRFHLATRVSFWWPAVIVLVLCGPWYWLTLDMASEGWGPGVPSANYTTAGIRYYLWSTIQITGVGLSVLAAIGFFAKIIRPFAGQGARGTWASLGALLISAWLFPSAVPSGLGDRYVIAAAPASIMFVVAGLVWIADRLPWHYFSARGKEGVVTAAVVVLFTVEEFSIPAKAWSGTAAAARYLVSAEGLRNSVFLVSSDIEGTVISEIAMREKRPGHIVLRASKVLANRGGKRYRVLYRTPAETMKYLEEVPVGVVMIDTTPALDKVPHHALLKETVLGNLDRWEPLGAYPLVKAGVEHSSALVLYRLRGHETKARAKIRIDMSRLGRSIVSH